MKNHYRLSSSNDSRWSIRKRSISIGICVLLLTTLSMTAYFSIQTNEVQYPRLVSNLQDLGIAADSPEHDAAVRAWEIIAPEVGTEITGIERSTSGSESFWSIEFQNQQQQAVILELTIDNLNVLFINEKMNEDDNPRWEISSDQARIIAERYIDNLVDNAWFEYSDVLRSNVYQDSIGWRVNFNHFVQDILVADDFVSIRINPSTGKVYSFSSNLNDIPYLPHFDIDAIDAHVKLNQILKRDISLQSIPKLAIIETTLDNGFELVWVLSECVTNIEYWISAYSGNYIGGNTQFSYYGSSFGVAMSDYDCFYEIAEDVHTRLLYNNYDSTIELDSGISTLSSSLLSNDIVIFVGHGDHSLYDVSLGLLPNYLVCSGIFPFNYFSYEDIPPSSTTLFYACACGSGLWGITTIARSAILSGVECFAGWTIDVTETTAVPYTQYFFDYAVNGKTFEQCKDYADYKTGIDDGEFVLYGDDSLHLTAYDSAPSFTTGTQGEDPYAGTLQWESPVLYQPLWGPDIDAYRKAMDGDHEFDLVIFACPETKLKVTVYYWRDGEYWYTLNSKQCSSPGSTLSFTFSHSSARRYLIVVSHTDAHGGWYRLNLDPILS